MIRPKKSGVVALEAKKNLKSTLCEFWTIRISARTPDGDGRVGTPGAVLALADRAGAAIGLTVCHSAPTLTSFVTFAAPR